MNLSTVRSATDPTISESPDALRPIFRRHVITEWLQSGSLDLVETLRRHPALLRDRSLLLELAVVEFRARRRVPNSMDLEEHCRRFKEFGSSIHVSIFHQLEAQRFIDDNPQLLELLHTSKWPKAGEEFANFHVIEELGYGATAHVYLCREQDVGYREVVVKATPLSSFEASILGRLNHANIIPIYSTGCVEEYNLHYLCMPFCGRSTLTDLLAIAFEDGVPRRDDAIALAAKRWMIDEHPADRRLHFLPDAVGRQTYVDGILDLAIQISDALCYAHEQQILHGDLKPSNVLLTPHAKPLLLDFNLSQDYTCSAAKYGGGTLPYMPPEHLRLVTRGVLPAEESTFDPTSDVYSFGSLLYELLTGETPVSLPRNVGDLSRVAQLLLDQIEHGQPPIRAKNPLVSRRLEALILNCLALDKSDRPATMAEIKRKLKAERRSLASVSRFARVRPFQFVAVVGLPIAILSAAIAYFAMQPPRHINAYERGLQLASAGKIDDAIDQFAVAVDAQPAYAPARFELARSRVARGELDLAMNDFHLLARKNKDVQSMAYLGYCFNLKRVPAGAIEWYELAIRNGATSAAIYNNLAASYLDAPTRMRYVQQLAVAEELLHKAIELEPTSVSIKLNILRHAEAQANLDDRFNPFTVGRHAQSLVQDAPDDPLVKFVVDRWYEAAIKWHAAQDRRHREQEVSDIEYATSLQEFAAIQRILRRENSDAVQQDASRRSPKPAKNSSPLTPSYFLEPQSLFDSHP